MIGQIVTDADGNPVDGNGKSLSASRYQPSQAVKELFSRVQTDYQTNWNLQQRGFEEFDGVSLLERARLDQQLFATYVGCEYVAPQKRWRWRGRKNTARNKLIGILAHVLAGMLYPFVYAKNEQGDEEKLTAQVMRILIEDCLRKAKYEVKFLNMALTALVNPAVFVNPEWVESVQKIHTKTKSGEWKTEEVVDEVLTGMVLNVIPIDEILLGDFYTGPIQEQPNIIRVRRVPYAVARAECAGKYFDSDGKDLFDYVQAGMTRIVLAGQDGQTLFDVDWTEADANCVQIMTAYYRQDDLEVKFVGGVFMGSEKDIYVSNPFRHRRMVLSGEEWKSIPVYPFAKSGFEPIDPTGRFAYYKSGAFKEYWDDKALNYMHRLALDGTSLDVMKPMFLAGIAKADSTVIAPGATIGMPLGATATPYQLGPNLRAAYDAIESQRRDMSESTQDPILTGHVEKGVTAYATGKAEQNARIFLGVFGLMIADLITQVGELCMDLVVSNMTLLQFETTVPGETRMRMRTYLAKGKEKGRNINNKVVFTDEFMGKGMTEDQIRERSWKLYNSTGSTPAEREFSDMRVFMTNPYKFARTTYTMYVDPDRIVRKSMGLDRQEKVTAFNIMTDPRVMPFTDAKTVVEDFAIEEFGGSDPDRYKRKDTGPDMLNSMMMAPRQGTAAPPSQTGPAMPELSAPVM